jgi:hypothetical protein
MPGLSLSLSLSLSQKQDDGFPKSLFLISHDFPLHRVVCYSSFSALFVRQKFETEVMLCIAQSKEFIHALKLHIYCPGRLE